VNIISTFRDQLYFAGKCSWRTPHRSERRWITTGRKSVDPLH